MRSIASFFIVALCMAQTVHAQRNVLTKIVTYKVNLRPDSSLMGDNFKDPYFVYGQLVENWHDNKLLPADYQKFVHQAHLAASSGKIKVYDPYFKLDGYLPVFKKLPTNDVAVIGVDTIYKTLQRPYPPYEDFDTTLIRTFDPNDIVQIEFMEKWTWNPKTMRIKKQVIAYALWRKRMYMEIGEFMGLSRMYWIRLRK